MDAILEERIALYTSIRQEIEWKRKVSREPCLLTKKYDSAGDVLYELNLIRNRLKKGVVYGK